MRVWVIYALAHEQFLEQLDVPDGTTAAEAVQMSGLLDKHPEIDLEVNNWACLPSLCRVDKCCRKMTGWRFTAPCHVSPAMLTPWTKRKSESAHARNNEAANPTPEPIHIPLSRIC